MGERAQCRGIGAPPTPCPPSWALCTTQGVGRVPTTGGYHTKAKTHMPLLPFSRRHMPLAGMLHIPGKRQVACAWSEGELSCHGLCHLPGLTP